MTTVETLLVVFAVYVVAFVAHRAGRTSSLPAESGAESPSVTAP